MIAPDYFHLDPTDNKQIKLSDSNENVLLPVSVLHWRTRRKAYKVSFTESSDQAFGYPGLSSMHFCAENMCREKRNGFVYN
jgi:hypothetical protein